MFSSDPTKKARQEQMAVAVLGIIFVVTFLRGPAKNLGLFRSRAHPSAVAIDPTGVNLKPTVETLQQRKQQMDSAIDTAAVPSTDQVASPSKYSAQQLRNPFKSLIPELPPKPVEVVKTPAPVAPPAPPPPPPALDIQGLLWDSPTPQAIIGHRIYRVGDAISGMTILEIDYRGIRVDYHGESIVYPVSESPLKIPQAIRGVGSQQAQWR